MPLPDEARMARWPHALAALAFLALAVFAMAYALQLRMFAEGGPGAGLFPFFIGAGLALVSLERLDAPALLRLALQVAALAGFALLLRRLGYVPAAFLLAVATALVAGARAWAWILVVALLSSIGIRLGFSLLGTPL
jgi:hypothetical protein